jgi:hypothetical protein
LDEVAFGGRIGGLGRGQATRVAERAGVLGDDGGRGEDLLLAAGWVAQLLAGCLDGLLNRKKIFAYNNSKEILTYYTNYNGKLLKN